MRWQKLGIVYCPSGEQEWARSHAMLPTPILLDQNTLRVFITTCDSKGVGRPSYVDLDSTNLKKILKISTEPILDVGSPGTFDENGVAVCSVVRVDSNTLYMYYVGFELGTKIRYRLLTGLAISSDGGNSFRRYKETPILERSSKELFFRCGPMVRLENGKFRMWYVAGSEWTTINEKQMPIYSMKYVESSDGIRWPEEGISSLEVVDPDEHGFGRPWVMHEKESKYQLFYSIRKRSIASYRLGYATSSNGLSWMRIDKDLGIEPTPGQFDGEAIMYSAIQSLGRETYCFYNGNDFGKEGFALAKLIEK